MFVQHSANVKPKLTSRMILTASRVFPSFRAHIANRRLMYTRMFVSRPVFYNHIQTAHYISHHNACTSSCVLQPPQNRQRTSHHNVCSSSCVLQSHQDITQSHQNVCNSSCVLQPQQNSTSHITPECLYLFLCFTIPLLDHALYWNVCISSCVLQPHQDFTYHTHHVCTSSCVLQ